MGRTRGSHDTGDRIRRQSMTMTRLKQMVVMLTLVGGIGMVMAASFLAASYSRAQAAGEQGEDAEARAIIDKAIKAHGGADKLSQFKAVSAKWVGKRKVENVFYWDAVYVVTYEMPDKIRFDIEVENPKGGKFAFSRVVNGKKGWQGSVRGTRDLKEAEVAHIVDALYAHWLASVVPFKDKGFQFALVGSVTVDGKDAVGISVSCKGRPDVNL